MGSSTLTYVFQDITMSKDLSPWLYAYTALVMFIYQTLDAIDGKQARRTGSSSPLGQLFDHGCDAINVVMVAYVVMQIMKMGG